MNCSNERKWLSIEEAADRIGMAKRTLYNRISDGRSVPPHAKISGSNKRVFKVDDIDKWLEDQIIRPRKSKRTKIGRPTIAEQMRSQ